MTTSPGGGNALLHSTESYLEDKGLGEVVDCNDSLHSEEVFAAHLYQRTQPEVDLRENTTLETL